MLSVYRLVRCRKAFRTNFFHNIQAKPYSFVLSAGVTSSASIVNCAVSHSSPTMTLIEAFESVKMHEDVGFHVSGLLSGSASEYAVSL